MSLGKKIVLSFVFLSVLLGGLGIVWETYYSRITNEQLRESKTASSIVSYANEMEISLYQSLFYLNTIREVKKMNPNEQNIQRLPSEQFLLSAYQQELAIFDSSFTELEDLLGENNDLRIQLEELGNRIVLFRSLNSEWDELMDADPYEANLMFLSSIEPYFRNNIMPKLSTLRRLTVESQNDKIEELDAQLDTARFVNQIASSFAVLLGLVLAFYLYRSITAPVKKLIHSVNKIGEGDLKERVILESKDEIGHLGSAFNSMAESLEKKTISTEYLDNVLESIQEAIFVTDSNGVVRRVNGAASSMLGYGREEIIGKALNEFFYLKEPDQSSDKEFREEVVEYSLITRNKEHIPVLYSQADLIEQGNQIGSVNVASDISKIKEVEKDLKEVVEEKVMMLAEIHHRVKNNLAVISGLLQLQSYQSDNEEITQALADSQYRIQSMALVHEMLYESENLASIDYKEYISDLMQAISSMHYSDQKDIELVSEVEKFSLGISQAVPCSLLINEVLVNSFKHAFADQDEGVITVRAREVKGVVKIQVEDNGKGIDRETFLNSKTLGSTLIKTLTDQLQGNFDIRDNDGKGTIFELEFKRAQSAK